jgi:hypothetical protein
MIKCYHLHTTTPSASSSPSNDYPSSLRIHLQIPPATITMSAPLAPFSVANEQQSYSTNIDSKAPTAGGILAKGLNRLTEVIERRVDSQILAAQMRSYDTSSQPMVQHRYM